MQLRLVKMQEEEQGLDKMKEPLQLVFLQEEILKETVLLLLVRMLD